METRDLPDVVEATFGVGAQLSVKTLTSDTTATLLQEKHDQFWPVFGPFRAPVRAHSILPFASQNYHSKSRIPDPDPLLSGGLGQQ